MTNFCLCTHRATSHVDGQECSECNCPIYELDVFLEEGPDGKPVTTMLRPDDEYGPLELLS